MNWRPISELPSGLVLLYFPDTPGDETWAIGVWKGRWHYDGYDFDQNSYATIMTPYFYDDKRRVFVRLHNRRPTHWMPLPEPPSTEEDA